MTLMTVMTMNHRGSLMGVAVLFLEMRDGVMGGSMGSTSATKPVAVAVWFGRQEKGEETCCSWMQRLAHHAHRVLVQPVQVCLLAQPWQRTRPQGLCQVSTFYTTLVKKSQEANGALELPRTLLPRG
jgi:hypothetical protein